MYKRPSIRPREKLRSSHKNDIAEHSFLHKLVHPKPTEFTEHQRIPIYQQENYLKLLNKNQRELGLEEVTLELPPEPAIETTSKKVEPYLNSSDGIHVTLHTQKNGKVKVKLITSMSELYEKYYSKNKLPPTKTLLKTYKNMGFSDAFIEKLANNLSKKSNISKIVAEKIDKVFNKPTTAKPKKKKEPEPEQEPSDDEDDDEIEEDDDPGEDGELDVEIEPDDEEDPGVEEDFFIDDD